MNSEPKIIEPIPEQFSSYEEAAEFWDSHETTDYLDDFETIPVESQLQQRHYEVEIEATLFEILSQEAQNRNITVKTLINNCLKERFQLSS